MSVNYETLSAKVLRSRLLQLKVNEEIKAKTFKIPIHLALGHEALSEAISAAMKDGDKLLCSHRNIHYQFARGATLSQILEEFRLTDKGLSGGRGGSMNLTNPLGSIVYTSSILGNNLCVGVGVALSKHIKRENGVVIVITGDGAIEEGALYETVENARNLDLPLIVLVENNDWSLATQTKERRKSINLENFASSLGAGYTFMMDNNVLNYYCEFSKVRERVILSKIPEVIEVKLTTLGGWTVQSQEFSRGKYINYHAGLAPNVIMDSGLIINFDQTDPVYLIKETLGQYEFERLSKLIGKIF